MNKIVNMNASTFKGKKDLFKKRWKKSPSTQPTVIFAKYLATVIAEDVNLALYYQEYTKQGLTDESRQSTRNDYVEYLQNRIEYELEKFEIAK